MLPKQHKMLNARSLFVVGGAFLLFADPVLAQENQTNAAVDSTGNVISAGGALLKTPALGGLGAATSAVSHTLEAAAAADSCSQNPGIAPCAQAVKATAAGYGDVGEGVATIGKLSGSGATIPAAGAVGAIADGAGAGINFYQAYQNSQKGDSSAATLSFENGMSGAIDTYLGVVAPPAAILKKGADGLCDLATDSNCLTAYGNSMGARSDDCVKNGGAMVPIPYAEGIDRFYCDYSQKTANSTATIGSADAVSQNPFWANTDPPAYPGAGANVFNSSGTAPVVSSADNPFLTAQPTGTPSTGRSATPPPPINSDNPFVAAAGGPPLPVYSGPVSLSTNYAAPMPAPAYTPPAYTSSPEYYSVPIPVGGTANCTQSLATAQTVGGVTYHLPTSPGCSPPPPVTIVSNPGGIPIRPPPTGVSTAPTPVAAPGYKPPNQGGFNGANKCPPGYPAGAKC